MSDATDNFAAGYADDDAATAVPQTQVDKPEAKGPDATEHAAEASDPIKELMARFDKFEQGHKNLAGHIGGLKQQQEQLKDMFAAAQSATKQVQDAPSRAAITDAMKSPQEWEELKANFPEWATATEKFMDSRIAGIKQPEINPDDIARIVNERVKGETKAAREEIIEVALDTVLPDWKSEVQTEHFGKWLQSQKDDVKALAASDSVKDAAKMLKLYGQFKSAPSAKPNASRQKLLEAGVNPKGTGGHAPSTKTKSEFESGYFE